MARDDRRIRMTVPQARQLKRIMNMQLRGYGHCTITPTNAGWDISVHVPRQNSDSAQAPGVGTIVEEHKDYLKLRPIGAAVDDSTRDILVRKPWDLRVSSYHGKHIIDREGNVDVATSTGFSARTLASIDDEEDTEDQVVVPHYIPAQTKTIDGVATTILGSRIEYGPAATDDTPILNDAGEVLEGVAFVDLNRTAGRAFAEDNES